VHAHVVTTPERWRGGFGAVVEAPAQVLLLEHVAEHRGTPVGDQELQARTVAQTPVAVVAEDADHALPHLGHCLEGDPGAETDGEHRVGRQRPADPQVEPGAELGVHDTDERHVVDLVHDVVVR
jgi:hypothetical protein